MDRVTFHVTNLSGSLLLPSRFLLAVFAVLTSFVAIGDAASLATGDGIGSDTSLMHYSIPEEQPPGFPVANLIGDSSLQAALLNIDSGNEGHGRQLIFEVFRGQNSEYFSVESPSGQLRTNRSIDRDLICYKMASCIVRLDVAIVRPSQYFRVFKLAVTIVDINDNSPEFDQSTVALSISESASIGSMFVLPFAVDRDYGLFDVRAYELFTNDTGNRFRLRVNTDGIDLGSGAGSDVMLVVNGNLDREIESVFRAKLVATDGGSPMRTGTVELIITIQDANDNSPIFDHPVYNVTVREDFPVNGVVVTVQATDLDLASNGQVIYAFSRQTSALNGDTFALDPRRGTVTLRRRLDFEMNAQYSLIVAATDRAAEPRTTICKIHVIVEDRNDNAPQIRVNALVADGVAEVVENHPIGSFVAHISVDDVDIGENGRVMCELLRSNGQFVLQPLLSTMSSSQEEEDIVEYTLISNVVFDREHRSEFSLTLHCHDDGVPSLSASHDLVVRVADANDNAPRFEQASFSASVAEELPPGQPLVRLIASDLDIGENGRVEYALCRFDGLEHSDEQPPIAVDSATGLVTTAVVLDYEDNNGGSGPSYKLCVVAFDHGYPSSMSATTTLTLSVFDINDRAPEFNQPEYTFGTYENQPIETEIGSVVASDPDSPPHNRFEYSIVQETPEFGCFNVDAKTGRLTTTRRLDREQFSVHHLVLSAFDIDRPELTSQVNVTVFVADKNDNAPIISFPTPDNNLVEISRQAPVGYVITRVFANDADFANNARLSFQMVSGDQDSLFDVDPQLGAVSIRSDLRQASRDRYDVILAVSDGGTPPQSVSVQIGIVLTSASWSEMAIRQTVGDDESDQSLSARDWFGAFEFGRHRFILIILGCVTAVVVSLLLLAIVCVKCRRTKRHARHKAYQFNTDTVGDLKLTRNLLIDSSLALKTNVTPDANSARPASCSALPESATTRFATMPPGICESSTIGEQILTGVKLRQSLTDVQHINNRATISRNNNQNDVREETSKLNTVSYQLTNHEPIRAINCPPRPGQQHCNRAPIPRDQTEHRSTQPLAHRHHHHHCQHQQPVTFRRQFHPRCPSPVDIQLATASPVVTDISSGCSSNNGVVSAACTVSPDAARPTSWPPVTETDMDQVNYVHSDKMTTSSTSAPACCSSCVGRCDDVNERPLSRDLDVNASVSRGKGYCCSVQPLVASPDMMAAVGYVKDELPLPPPPLLPRTCTNDGTTKHHRRSADVTWNDRFRLSDVESTSLLKYKHPPPPLPPPRLTSLSRLNNS